jgi:hypothetical protein
VTYQTDGSVPAAHLRSRTRCAPACQSVLGGRKLAATLAEAPKAINVADRAGLFGAGRNAISIVQSGRTGGETVSTITTKDRTEIYYKDWGEGPVVVKEY